MAHYKLVALDMDGTLLNGEGRISKENKRWIRRASERGVIVMIATGRGMRTIVPFVEELELSSPIVAVNGSEVWSSPRTMWKRTVMETRHIRELYRMALDYDTWFWGYSTDGPFNRGTWMDDYERKTWLKFGFQTEDERIRNEIRNALLSWGTLEITNSNPDNMEVNPAGVTKAAGIREVCRLLEIDLSQVVAVGDSMNDIDMIRAAGLGVAMGNAQDAVKAAADLVTASNDRDGVAQVIRERVLEA